MNNRGLTLYTIPNKSKIVSIRQAMIVHCQYQPNILCMRNNHVKFNHNLITGRNAVAPERVSKKQSVRTDVRCHKTTQTQILFLTGLKVCRNKRSVVAI